MKIGKRFKLNNDITLYNGDCFQLLKELPAESVDLIITSPPYCMGKAYENPKDDIKTFKNQHERIFPDIYRALRIGGSVCWQVGCHVSASTVFPLDYFVYGIFTENSADKPFPLMLRNRIMWTYGHGLNSSQRFSGRYETLLWFTKGEEYNFDLDSVRIPQKYPGKKSYKGPNKGNYSGNPLGKNPSDVWDIPNVKAQHIEKTGHPCQFPVAIPQRLIKALTLTGSVILDPFMGSGSSGVAAVIEKRRFIGAEIQKDYYEIAVKRVKEAGKGNVKIREDVPVVKPDRNTSVAKIPRAFVTAKEGIR